MSDLLSNGPDGVYVNFTGDDSEETARKVYPGDTWDRLVEVKTRYDPENVFSSNVNIPPRPIVQ